MIKKVSLFLLSCFALLFMPTFANDKAAPATSLSNDTPENFLNRIVQTSNSNFKSQKTQLDDVSAASSWASGKYKITSTLGNISTQIEPYLQWITFIGMTAGVILLARNGFKLVTNSSGMVDGGDLKTVKGNIQNIRLTSQLFLFQIVFISYVISDELEKYKKDFVFKNKKNKSDLGNGNSPFDADFSYRSQDYST